MSLVHAIISLYIWVLFLTALLSWFPASSGGAMASIQRALHAITEPVLAPLRRVIPRPSVGGVGVDFSVFIAMIILVIVNRLI
jgi:YggT family protein